MTRVSFRPSTLDDFVRLTGSPPVYRVRSITAFVGEPDGSERPLGIGGVIFLPDGTNVASIHISDELRRYPVALHKVGLLALEDFRKMGLTRVVATADPFPAARRWLIRLGFTPEMQSNGEIFVWEPDRSS